MWDFPPEFKSPSRRQNIPLADTGIQYFQMVVRLQSGMEDQKGALSTGVSHNEAGGAVDSIARLTDIPFQLVFLKIPAASP